MVVSIIPAISSEACLVITSYSIHYTKLYDQDDPQLIMRLTKVVEAQQTPFCGKQLVQWHGKRAVVMEPPAFPIDGPDLDALYELPFMRAAHPSYKQPIPA